MFGKVICRSVLRSPECHQRFNLKTNLKKKNGTIYHCYVLDYLKSGVQTEGSK